ncbi:MAG TPA: DegV family protein [Anaerolineales bacterium]|jgi:DegV family protein with EDD domain|nr:DegV family protein [Anaerolineales bacterium]
MSKVAIVTDSTACIPIPIMDELNIHWLPYYIHRGEETLRDMVSITPAEFYTWLPTAEELPHTAIPGPGEYLAMYQKLAEKEGVQQIASIHMTSKGSGAFQAAQTAKEMLKEVLPDLVVEVIDTLNVSMCHGWMVIEAAREAMQGASLKDVVNKVAQLVPVTRMLQTADTLKYLYMGGRIGRAQHLAGSLLNIKPLISMEDGIIVSLGTARSRKRAYQMMVEKIESVVGRNGEIKIAYVHAAALEEAEKIQDLVEARLTTVETIFAELSPALGVHTGPGTAGLCYYPVLS